MKLMRSNLLNQILLIGIAQLITDTFTVSATPFAASPSSSSSEQHRHKTVTINDNDSFKPKLIKLDEWVVADLNTSTLVNNVSLLVTKLNNYTGGVVHAFELFHTELNAFGDVLNQTVNVSEEIQQRIDKMLPNKVIINIIEPMVNDFRQRVTAAVDQLRTEVNDYYKGIKFGTEESFERVTHDLKVDLNDVLTETEVTPNSTIHGQVAVMDIVDLAHEYYNQFENGLLREAIALSEFRRVLKDKNNATLQQMTDSIITPFFDCEHAPDQKIVACLQDVYNNGTNVKEILNLDELIGKFGVRFQEKRAKYIAFIDSQTDSAVELFAKTMKVFYEVIGKLRDDNAPNNTNEIKIDLKVFILTLSSLLLFYRWSVI